MTDAEAATPERRCVGCGRRAAKSALKRLAVAEGRVVVDHAQRCPGRGAYLCGVNCMPQALKRKAFGRAFRGKAAPPGRGWDPERLIDDLTGAL